MCRCSVLIWGSVPIVIVKLHSPNTHPNPHIPHAPTPTPSNTTPHKLCEHECGFKNVPWMWCSGKTVAWAHTHTRTKARTPNKQRAYAHTVRTSTENHKQTKPQASQRQREGSRTTPHRAGFALFWVPRLRSYTTMNCAYHNDRGYKFHVCASLLCARTLPPNERITRCQRVSRRVSSYARDITQYIVNKPHDHDADVDSGAINHT